MVILRLSRETELIKRMEDLSHLFESQRLALDKLAALVGIDQINHIVVQRSDVLQARLKEFMRFLRLYKLVKFMTCNVGYADTLHSGFKSRA